MSEVVESRGAPLSYDNPTSTSVSDPFEPFTYASPRPLYVAVAANQAGRDLELVSYVDGNVVSEGSTTSPADGGRRRSCRGRRTPLRP